jgi:hypothetical protein
MSRSFRRLRPAFVVALLVLISGPAVRAAEIPGSGLRFAGVGEIFAPLVDLVSRLWVKEGSGLDPSGGPRNEAGGGLDPSGAPRNEAGSGLDPSGVH